MTVHPHTLLLCSTLLMTASAALMSLFGGSHRVYRGYRCWTAAQWLAALGLGLQLWGDGPPGLLPVANLLLMQWPVLLLAGFRRFRPRGARDVAPLADWLLLGISYLLWVAAWAAGENGRWQVAAFSAGMLLLHLHTASSLLRFGGFSSSVALKSMLVVLLSCCVTYGWRLATSLGDGPTMTTAVLLSDAVIHVMCSLMMLYLALLLTCERTQQELAASQHRLKALANIDTLTQVPNRRHFHELAQQALEANAPGTAALLMIDIDHFKRINDLLGHKAGDQALSEVARSMRHSLRLGDVAGRLGGDEFVALLPATSVHDAIAVADRIVSPLSAGVDLPLSLSFGVVRVQESETLDEALHRADQALYEAKRQGRNCAVVATGKNDEPVFTASMPLGLMAM